MNRLENDSVAEGHLAVVAFMLFSLERLHQTPERVLFERNDIIQDAFAAIGRDRVKLFCGAGVNVDGPNQGAVRRGSRICPGHLSLGLLYESAFLPSENVVGINQPLWLYEHTIVFLCERHKIPLCIWSFSNISRGMTTWRRWPIRPMGSRWLWLSCLPWFQII